MGLAKWKVIDLFPVGRTRFTVYTDACALPSSSGGLPYVGLCYIIFDHAKATATGGVAVLTDPSFHSLDPHLQYIAVGEAFAPLLCLFHVGELLRGESVVFYLDNLSLLSALCKGSCTVVDFGSVVHAIQLYMASFGLLTWYEHVDSEANVADGGSRKGVEDPLARSMGIVLRTATLPPWPADVRAASAQVWLAMLSG